MMECSLIPSLQSKLKSLGMRLDGMLNGIGLLMCTVDQVPVISVPITWVASCYLGDDQVLPPADAVWRRR